MDKLLHFYKLPLLSLVLLLNSFYSSSQTTLTAGDIAILGFNADDPVPNQRWAFVALTDLAAGTKINFTDAGYDATTGEFRTGATNEGHMMWTLPSPIQAGTIIYATNTTINGSTTGVSGQLGNGTTFGFSTAGDQIIAYQGTLGTAAGATFIYAINTGQGSLYGSNGSWLPAGSGALAGDQFSYIPPGLNATTAVALTSNVGNTSSGTGAVGSPNYGFDNMYYAGTFTGYKYQILADIANSSNWAGDNTTTANISPSAGSAFPTGTFVILPVTLIAFEVQLQSTNVVKVSWSTANEINNSFFEVQSSADGINFSAIGRIEGKLNSTTTENYSFIDATPQQGVNYYRLKQVDLDGNVKLFSIKSVTVPTIKLQVTPNPAIDEVRAYFAAGLYKQVQLVSGSGQVLKVIILAQNETEARFSMSSHASGNYYLCFIGKDGSTIVKNLIKAKSH
ncbi:MAG: hypothetical protein ACTHJ0_02030 [Flavipsychrobacter sp.]